MRLDDRFTDNHCTTCGITITSNTLDMIDDIQRHHDWHNQLERFVEVIASNLDIPSGSLKWD
jgi:hypothetical protein